MLGGGRVRGRARAVGGAIKGIFGLSLGERRVEKRIRLNHHAIEDRQRCSGNPGDGSALFSQDGMIADGREGEHGRKLNAA